MRIEEIIFIMLLLCGVLATTLLIFVYCKNFYVERDLDETSASGEQALA